MWVRVLGSAAGGGYPQWNCTCAGCRAVRDGSRPSRTRTQDSIAVSVDARHWFLLNASPDIQHQIEAFDRLHPWPDRVTPLQTVLLTDAELDHTVGLLLLREADTLDLHAAQEVQKTLGDGATVLSTLQAYCPVTHHTVTLEAENTLSEDLTYHTFDAPTTKPMRSGSTSGGPGRVAGFRLTDRRSGQALVYLPGMQQLTAAVRAEIEDCACVLIDGTCWSDDELIRQGLGRRTARQMGHLPIDGPGGSLEQLSALHGVRRIYTHMNNSNPILLEDSPQRRQVEDRGLEVAADGMEVRI